MKLSDETIDILKSFSTINQSIMLKKGKVQRTICPDKVILAEVELEESIPQDFGIYDLNPFIASISMMNQPDLSFSDKNVIMKNSSDQWELTFGSCSPTIIQIPPEKNLVMNKIDVRLEMNSDMIQKMTRVAQINSWLYMTITGKNNVLTIIAHEKSNPDSGSLSKVIGSYSGPEFDASFKISNLKIVPDDYDVEIMLNGFAKFISKNKPLKYFIALESAKD